MSPRRPLCFAAAIAPHLAARETKQTIDLDALVAGARALQWRADRLIIEGAGGFLVPLDEQHDMADLAVALAEPVILVVGLRLGCLNHAQLTQEAILRRGLRLAGWVGNVLEPAMSRHDDNIASLQRLLQAPCLGVLPRSPSAAAAASSLQTHFLDSSLPPGNQGRQC